MAGSALPALQPVLVFLVVGYSPRIRLGLSFHPRRLHVFVGWRANTAGGLFSGRDLKLPFEAQVGDATWEAVRNLRNRRNVVWLEQGGDTCQFNLQSSADLYCSNAAVPHPGGRPTRESESGSTLRCQMKFAC